MGEVVTLSSAGILGAAAAAALAIAWVGTPAFRWCALRWGFLDRASARSLHQGVVARAGGVVIVLAAAVGLAVASPIWSGGAAVLAIVLGLALVVGVGIWDDRWGASPWIRLLAQVLAATAVVTVAGGIDRLPLPAPLDLPVGLGARPLALLWIVAVVNFYNFLDGIDGLAAAQGAITGIGLALAGWDGFAAACGAAIAGACAGFLAHNWAPARIFMGDVGSGALGFLFACLPFLASGPQRPKAVLFVALSLWLFLADATWTLVRRLLRRERLHHAHQEHLYQRLVTSGRSHAQVTLGLALGAGVLTAAALAAWRSEQPVTAWAALAVACAVFGLELAAEKWSRTTGTSPSASASSLFWGRLADAVRSPLAGAQRRWILLALDAVLAGVALYVAYLLRFEGRIPPYYAQQYARFLPLLVGVRLATNGLFGVHNWSFRLAGLPEGVRFATAGLVGSATFVAVPYLVQIVGPPRSVVALEFFLCTSLGAVIRFSSRLTQPLVLRRLRSRSVDGVVRTLIVGAGGAGDLLLRNLTRSPDHPYHVLGFVDDDRAKWRTHIGGRPVLGGLDELPSLARRLEVRQLLFAIQDPPPARMRRILADCAELKLGYKALSVSFAQVPDRGRAPALHDLAPEDLLARDPAAFDLAERRRLVEGRRVLVTGAAGSIGSEICRQLALSGAKQIVLVDMNENALYFLYRELQARHAGLAVSAEVADIRDRERLIRLGREYRPDYVFHAAAHKHVPLMEYTPEEAIKNNVTGCLHAVEMAEAAGASRFVLVSTDKAVQPTSVMGATKKVAELIVRERATRSSTAFTVVRFGNVLGSAGSVVPLFKQQIADGGPVTVTHPDCRRYLMTIHEAVGLVLVAGLGDHGDLCVLDMGEPIRILELARLMITLSGRVAEHDVPIVFTGLRPGEKLDETVMTEDEARQSWSVGHKIRVVKTPPPDAALLRRLRTLEAAAQRGDREAVRTRLQDVIPDYLPAEILTTRAARGA